MGRGSLGRRRPLPFVPVGFPNFLESTRDAAVLGRGREKERNGIAARGSSLIAFKRPCIGMTASCHQLFDQVGNYRPESGFQVVSKDGKREYGIPHHAGRLPCTSQETPHGILWMNRVETRCSCATPMELLGRAWDAQGGTKVSGHAEDVGHRAAGYAYSVCRALTPKTAKSARPSGLWTKPLKAVGRGVEEENSPRAENAGRTPAAQRQKVSGCLRWKAMRWKKAQTKYAPRGRRHGAKPCRAKGMRYIES